jgi:putative Holliday junction resolvase
MANYLGLDIGRKRVGLSRGDGDLKMALPVRAVLSHNRETCLREIAAVIHEFSIDVAVAGYPINMDGFGSEMSAYVDEFVAGLKGLVGDAVKFITFDERLTSSQAETDLRAARGEKFESPKRKRELRRSGAIDSNAAAIILQDYFDELALNASLIP